MSHSRDPENEEESREHALLEGLLEETTAGAEEADPQLRRRRAELEPIVRALRAYGENEREALLAEARNLDQPPHEDAAIARLLEEMDAARPAPRRLAPLAWLAAAAAIALTLFLAQRDGPPEPFYLGAGGELELELAPAGETGAPAALTWLHLAPGGSYTLEVRRLDALDAEPLVRVADLLEPRWPLDPGTLAALREGIRWQVYVYDELNRLVGSAWVDARSSP
ncbi:MAG: hypothetical protein VYE81_11890 [Planctomycetota bacterium]|nr:hypothetical protein [Planctomycetota bacterium]